MEKWTETLIPDQTGRVALVTGANSGIGLEAAKLLAERGAHVVLACRTRSKAEAARTEIMAAHPSGQVSLIDLDLSSLASVAAAAAEFTSQFDHLDLLINNAGVMATPYKQTVDGYELQFATNHLGHAALTAHLLPALLTTEASRVVNVSSLAHRMGRINFDDLQSERRYHAWRAYGQSKLSNLLFTFELQRRLAKIDATTIATAAHPGFSETNLATSTGGNSHRMMTVTKPLTKLMSQSARMGSLPTLRAATDPDAHGGNYFGPSGFLEQRGFPSNAQVSKTANDTALAARLWDTTIALTGVPFAALDAG